MLGFMDRRHIAQVLSEIAAILEIKGENPFKIRAYENAARIVDGLSNLEELIEAEELTSIKGIGKNLAEHITELSKTGRLKEYESLIKSIPSGLLEMLSIPGVGAKKVKVFWEKLEIETIGELEYACQENRLRDLPGFGQKSQDKILQGILYLKKHQGKHLYPYALASAMPLLNALKNNKNVIRVQLAGSLRRKKETVKDIDIVVSTKLPEKVMNSFTRFKDVDSIVARGETKSSVVLKSGINADLRCVSDAEFPYALHHFTGSKEHNTAMRSRSKKMSLKMNEYGLFKGDKNIKCKDEAEIFKKLDLEFIQPELREDMGEISAAEKEKLPVLIEDKDIKGMLHVHTNASDGSNTIEEMAQDAKKMGYTYLGICDHSQTAAYAGGLKPKEVLTQHKEIDRLNKKLKGMTILKGIESDILADGSLDYKDDILKRFDFVLGSIHSRFSMPEAEMTERICKALKNPYLKILGHPTGRLLLAREGYAINMHKVIDTAAKYGKAIELNANPHRLDIDWRYGPYVKKQGVKIAICTDAHSIEGMHDMLFGVGIARKAWLTKEDVVNAWSVEKFMKWLNY